MSLVVAQISSNRVELTGDSRLTFHDGSHSNHFNSGLKIILFSERLCVAYAGIVEYGERFIREIAKQESINAIVKTLENASQADADDAYNCEFIVASSKPTYRRIIKISAGHHQEFTEGRTWIGDKDAYNIFQERFNSYKEDPSLSNVPQDIKESSRLVGSMKATIDNNSSTSVGGLQITVNDTGMGFLYMVSMQSETYGHMFPPGFSAVPLSLGPGRDSLAVELKPPEKTGIGAVGVYIHEARAGVVYAPLQLSTPLKIERVNADHFRLAIFKQLGFKLVGGGIGLQPPPRDSLRQEDICNCGSGVLYAKCHYDFDNA